MDDREPRKQLRAADVLRILVGDSCGFVSQQVAMEFISNLLKKFGKTVDEAETALQELGQFQYVQTDLTTVRLALEVKRKASTSFWDAAHLATAAQNGCEIWLSEDQNHGQIINGVKIVNPFF